VLTVIATKMTITGRSLCSTNSDVTITGGIYAVLTGIMTRMTKTGRFICSVNIYCDNNGEVYMQC
jgi:hypothetical protein